MIKRSEVLYAILGALALSTSARADMMPVSRLDGGPVEASCPRELAISEEVGSPAMGVDWPLAADLHSLAGDADVEQTGVTQPVRVLSDDQSSLSLCLYALMGFGLCRSAPWVKKLHLGWVPQWYHDGGPLQIGHSHAISPDCLCHAPVCCFVQPEGTADPHVPRYHFATIVARWRNSLFTPAVLASQAPPSFC